MKSMLSMFERPISIHMQDFTNLVSNNAKASKIFQNPTSTSAGMTKKQFLVTMKWWYEVVVKMEHSFAWFWDSESFDSSQAKHQESQAFINIGEEQLGEMAIRIFEGNWVIITTS